MKSTTSRSLLMENLTVTCSMTSRVSRVLVLFRTDDVVKRHFQKE